MNYNSQPPTSAERESLRGQQQDFGRNGRPLSFPNTVSVDAPRRGDIVRTERTSQRSIEEVQSGIQELIDQNSTLHRSNEEEEQDRHPRIPVQPIRQPRQPAIAGFGWDAIPFQGAIFPRRRGLSVLGVVRLSGRNVPPSTPSARSTLRFELSPHQLMRNNSQCCTLTHLLSQFLT